MGVRANGSLGDAARRLNQLADRLENPDRLLEMLGQQMTAELTARVPQSTPYRTGTLKRGLGYFRVAGHHVTIGDPNVFKDWDRRPPEHTIANFIRYMLRNKLGYLWRKGGGGWNKKKAKVKPLAPAYPSTTKVVRGTRRKKAIAAFEEALRRVLSNPMGHTPREWNELVERRQHLRYAQVGFTEQRQRALKALAGIESKLSTVAREEARKLVAETFATERELAHARGIERKTTWEERRRFKEKEKEAKAKSLGHELKEANPEKSKAFSYDRNDVQMASGFSRPERAGGNLAAASRDIGVVRSKKKPKAPSNAVKTGPTRPAKLKAPPDPVKVRRKETHQYFTDLRKKALEIQKAEDAEALRKAEANRVNPITGKREGETKK